MLQAPVNVYDKGRYRTLNGVASLWLIHICTTVRSSTCAADGNHESARTTGLYTGATTKSRSMK